MKENAMPNRNPKPGADRRQPVAPGNAARSVTPRAAGSRRGAREPG